MNTPTSDLQIPHTATPEAAIAAIHAIAASATQDLANISFLIAAFDHHHPAVRTAAGEVLVKLGTITVKPLIAACAATQDQGFQAYVIQALAQIGDAQALDLLTTVVGTSVANHCQGNVRRIAARGLGKIASNCHHPEVIQTAQEKLIWALLTPEDWGLRYAAAVSLQEIATPEAKAALQQAIAQEADPVVRSRMAIALV
ncbi:PBS lyase HEAT-like repeat protein [Nostoc sp. PCC 7524]|uniref:HEAT repeat domain-containing protein n=1 Tax=Nostoc sp. (strain ATCC 29411 / PCC 7524) TaxID=28072 RepID=UPI00029F07BB|nr:HEAT repeat domain-containing protein [Nostoc sp. PCC 7524]AFY49938.1 PBS lyase HEAT-like repeat protein [Nostoc sp. PCC 7524]